MSGEVVGCCLGFCLAAGLVLGGSGGCGGDCLCDGSDCCSLSGVGLLKLVDAGHHLQANTGSESHGARGGGGRVFRCLRHVHSDALFVRVQQLTCVDVFGHTKVDRKKLDHLVDRRGRVRVGVLQGPFGFDVENAGLGVVCAAA